MTTWQTRCTGHAGRWAARLAVAAMAGVALPALAAGGGGGGGGGRSDDRVPGASPEYDRAVVAIQAQRWADAIKLLESHLRLARKDADGHNWLAYAYRKSGRLEPAFEHYQRALQLEPTHRGAHEYIGEAYLMAGQPELAECHLRELARICAPGCEEHDDLKAAITQYRAQATAAALKP